MNLWIDSGVDQAAGQVFYDHRHVSIFGRGQSMGWCIESGWNNNGGQVAVAKNNKATLGISALLAAFMPFVLVGCSGGDNAVAETTDFSNSSNPVISDSAQNAVSDLFGDIGSDLDQAAVTAERVAGVAYNDGEVGVLESSVDLEQNMLQVKVQGTEGRRVSMKNGGSIRLRDGFVAEIFIDPYPTHTLTAWVDLYLHDGNDSVFKDVKVQIDYDMYSMGHGPFFTVTDKSPNGHYTFRLDYVMFGPWMQFFSIPDPEIPGKEYTMEVVIVAVP
ncbi:MAG: hypothetical protein HQ477_04955 [Chloroflexi bacterium]|nr:hypothetical protein [Chloroflexota bacterium]